VETAGINPENIAPSCASMHQVPAEAPTHPYWPRIDDEGSCERTARLPVSRSSTTLERLLRGPYAPTVESTARLAAGRANNREVLEGKYYTGRDRRM
jgi:hypothetical protein